MGHDVVTEKQQQILLRNAANIAMVLGSFKVSLSYTGKGWKRLDREPTFNSDAISWDVTMLTRYIDTNKQNGASLPKIALLRVYIYACIPKNRNGRHLVKQTQYQLESSGPF